MVRTLAAAIACLLPVAAAGGCAEGADPCTVAGGTYHIELPRDAAAPLPAILFLHGYGSSGSGALRNRGMVDAALARGYAVIAPDGTAMNGHPGRRWNFGSDATPLREEDTTPLRDENEARLRDEDAASQRDENTAPLRDDRTFLMDVRDAAVRDHGIDPGRTLLAGFSIGGSMVSYVACAMPDAFPAYAPLSGGFWRPLPERCAGPVDLIHTHGWTDGTVPLEGRVLRRPDADAGAAPQQGDIFDTIEIWRDANDCPDPEADAFSTGGDYWRRRWTTCAPGSRLEFVLFPGGHGMPAGWTDLVLDWFEAK